MRSKRTSLQEQLRLITECRQSGLTDYEWCQQHDIKVSTFSVWVHRLKKNGEIDIPAVIPTVIRKEPVQPDIVRIRIEGEKAPEPVMDVAIASEIPEESFPAMAAQSGYPVMEVMLNGVHLRVTNEVNLRLLADTIRLLRGAGC